MTNPRLSISRAIGPNRTEGRAVEGFSVATVSGIEALREAQRAARAKELPSRPFVLAPELHEGQQKPGATER